MACRGLSGGLFLIPKPKAPSTSLSENETIGLGDAFVDFEEMEGNPHGSAHVSFGGSISSIPTAAKDPLFFMLHANVDRLWAKWQAQFGGFEPHSGKIVRYQRGRRREPYRP